jgi:hypothetical protein
VVEVVGVGRLVEVVVGAAVVTGLDTGGEAALLEEQPAATRRTDTVAIRATDRTPGPVRRRLKS